jgi:uncharacterized protein involved in tolerance to divalent cations/uncharacterized glyoxalase superfamily protein PhnB
MADCLQVFTSTASKDDAQRIAQELVSRRLAACVQVLGPIASTYWWNGKVETADEWLCLAKTEADVYPAVERTILEVHPYEVPEVVAVPLTAGSPAYLEWLAREVTAEVAVVQPSQPSPPAPQELPRLYRVIVPVTDLHRAVAYYRQVLGQPGERVSPGRHNFDCGGTILACYDPQADGDERQLPPNPEHLYLAVADLEAVFARAQAAGGRWIEEAIAARPWGERSFYVQDPFGNPLCFVDAATVFTGHKPYASRAEA